MLKRQIQEKIYGHDSKFKKIYKARRAAQNVGDFTQKQDIQTKLHHRESPITPIRRIIFVIAR